MSIFLLAALAQLSYTGGSFSIFDHVNEAQTSSDEANISHISSPYRHITLRCCDASKVVAVRLLMS